LVFSILCSKWFFSKCKPRGFFQTTIEKNQKLRFFSKWFFSIEKNLKTFLVMKI